MTGWADRLFWFVLVPLALLIAAFNLTWWLYVLAGALNAAH